MTDEPTIHPEIDEPRLRHRPAKRDDAEVIAQGLLESDPSALLNLLGIPVDRPVTVIETGIFPHILPIDRVLRVAASKPWIGIVALATSPDPDIVHSLHVTLTTLLVMVRRPIPLDPIVVLVRPEADDPTIVGELSDELRGHSLGLEAWHPAGHRRSTDPDLADDQRRRLGRRIPRDGGDLRRAADARPDAEPGRAVPALVPPPIL